jgi:hypothetical protein
MEHNILEEINKDQRKLNEIYKELDKQKDVLRAKLNELRMCEVNNVLEFVKLHLNKLDSKRIHTLLVHCQNKLHGNIDSVFLIFENDICV